MSESFASQIPADPNELESLRLQLERHRTMLAALGEGVVIVCSTGEVTEFNPRAQELMDETHFEFRSIFPVPAGWHLRNVEGREITGEELPAGITLRTGKRCRNVLLEMQRPDNSRVWLSVNTEPIFRPGEELPFEVVVSFHDVTALKKAHDQLQAREARHNRILDAIPDLLFILSTKGHFLDYRVPSEDILFMPPEQFLGRTVNEVLPLSLAEPIMRCLQDAVRTGRTQTVSYSAAPYQPDKFYEARASILDPSTVLMIVRDVTESRQAEERERKHQQELAHMSRLNALGEMVAGISHEINQPLAAIANFSSAILNEMQASSTIDRGKIYNRFEEIRKQAYRAGEIVKRFRRFSSPVTRRSTITCGELIRESLELLDAELRRRAVTVHLPEKKCETLFVVDRVQIQQVLVNLILNACDAVEKNPQSDREIIIRTQLSPELFQIEVSDNGVGLPDVPLGQLFTSFFTTKSSGLGLGLAISRSIMEAHGGRLIAKPNHPRGATFVMELPLNHQDQS